MSNTDKRNQEKRSLRKAKLHVSRGGQKSEVQAECRRQGHVEALPVHDAPEGWLNLGPQTRLLKIMPSALGQRNYTLAKPESNKKPAMRFAKLAQLKQA